MSFTENFVLASQLPACPPNCPLLGLFLGFHFLFLKCFNNVLHDLAADNITVRQGNSSNIVYIFQNRSTLLKSGIRLFGKVDLCYIAVRIILEPVPIRVSAIFKIGSVAFWLSSMMIILLFKVRPRIYARGATSMIPRSLNFAA